MTEFESLTLLFQNHSHNQILRHPIYIFLTYLLQTHLILYYNLFLSLPSGVHTNILHVFLVPSIPVTHPIRRNVETTRIS
jgi:hypothetical protein